MTPTLEQRIARLEDTEAIQNLKARYAAYCDDGYDPEGIAALFVENGIWEASTFGTHTGRKAIREFMSGISSNITWALHCVTNPHIEVSSDGRAAVGTWYLLTLCTMTRENDSSTLDPVVMSGIYRDEFVKVDGRWWFEQLRCQIQQISNLDRGWVEQPFR